MASNKFATMLHKNCHKLLVILVYAVIEWILILLLLLNSFFLYLITKYANYFGLKPPCLWCSRVDHVLEPGKNTNSYRELLCETHAAEISNLGYCSNHRKLADTQTMCMECSASRPSHNYHSLAMATRISFFSWVNKDELENGCKILKCSCCNQSFNNNSYSPYLLLKHSWKALKYTEKGSLIIESVDDDNGSECKLVSKPDSFTEIERSGGEEHQILSDVGSFGLKDSAEEECSGSESNFLCYEKEPNEDQKAHDLCIEENESYGFLDCIHPFLTEDIGEDCLLEFNNLHFEKSSEYEVNRLIPVKEIDESTCANHGTIVLKKEDPVKEYHQDETFDSTIQIDTQVYASADEENTSYAEVDSMEKINDDDDEESFVLNLEVASKDFDSKACAHVNLQAAQILPTGIENIQIADTRKPDDLQAQEEEKNDLKLLIDQTQFNLLTDLPDHVKNQPQEQESTPSLPSLQEHFPSIINNSGAEISNSSEPCVVDNEEGTNYREKIVTEEQSVTPDKNQETVNQISFIHSESNEAEEEKFPETPTSVDSFNYLHKKLLLFEKRESGTEDSLDGSVVSEMDCGDPVPTVEKLTTTLKAERKALNALYAELEEERSASAVAANQTMAMINRLQEEKAAMQMEALQYQRMMEEQSEYDQEALQLLNEFMIKREREKQELEKELEFYRKKVMDYEAIERMRMIRRSNDRSVRSRTSSATCSNAEDLDELSIDLNHEARDEDCSIFGNQDSSNNNTPSDEVINLEEIALDCVKQISAIDDSLAEFEEERLSILDQLKALEEKLLTLHDNELEEDAKSVDHSSKYSVKGSDESYELNTPEETDISHASSKDKYHIERKTVGSMAKSLLPILDAADNETEGLIFDENVASEFVEMEHISVPKIELDTKKVTLEEEVDHVYERLQALEADREFLKHCMSSIKKGDKGVDLLQEILQHLRDLRAVELRVRSMSDGPLC